AGAVLSGRRWRCTGDDAGRWYSSGRGRAGHTAGQCLADSPTLVVTTAFRGKTEWAEAFPPQVFRLMWPTCTGAPDAASRLVPIRLSTDRAGGGAGSVRLSRGACAPRGPTVASGRSCRPHAMRWFATGTTALARAGKGMAA